MSNRSYLYSLNFNPSDRAKTKEDLVNGLSECSSYIPIAYRILLSANPKLTKSLIWEDEHPIALLSDFEPGRKRLFDFLDAVSKIGAYNNDKLNLEISKTKAFLNDSKVQAKYILLEAGEIFEFTETPFETQAAELLEELKTIDKSISEFLSELTQWKKEKDESELKLKIHNNVIFKLLLGIFGSGRKRKIEKEMKDAENRKWFELGIEDWSDILYFDFSGSEEDEAAEVDEDEKE